MSERHCHISRFYWLLLVFEGSRIPFRGELGEATEGAIRTFAFIRWPGHVKPDISSYAMFSIMDFFPTLASIVGGKMPTDRPIDGVDQSDVLFDKSTVGHRENLLTFIGPQLVAERWKQWRIYFTDIHPTGIGARDFRPDSTAKGRQTRKIAAADRNRPL